MPPEPAPAPTRRAVSPLDHRLEAATGHDINTLWTYRDRGVLDDQHAQLVDRHRELAKTQTGVTFYLRLLNRLSSGEFDFDGTLFTRIDRGVDQLEEVAGAREAAAREMLAALKPVEAAAASSAPVAQRLSTDDHAALLAIAGGAKLYEHLLTGRMSVTAATGHSLPPRQAAAAGGRRPGRPGHGPLHTRRATDRAHRCRTSRGVRHPQDPHDAGAEAPDSTRCMAVNSGAAALNSTERSLVVSHRTGAGPEVHPPGRLRSGRPRR
ncbi:hypothetical protein [Streptomyces luteolus]|uniref:hypothetical protein n=1 Tax=Streptomyces luteolus TaxID=3043615 RepID=UPI0032B7AEE3